MPTAQTRCVPSSPVRFCREVAAAWLLLSVAAASGCSFSTRFHHDWKSCCCPGGTSPAGCWEGSWQSHCTGHQGRVKAIVVKLDDSHYEARFAGTFWGFVPFQYTMIFTAQPDEEQYLLAGDKRLGRCLGVYHFSGHSNASEFVAHYQSCKDHGTFSMCRRHCCSNYCDNCCHSGCETCGSRDTAAGGCCH